MKSKKNLLLILLISITSITWAQKEVEGIVLDEQNIPLLGANILVKGTTNGASADFDGRFKIKAKIGDVLVVSFLGMKTKEVTVINYQPLSIVLELNNALLDDIIIIGYGTQKKSDVTGAISSLKSESFNKGIVANAGQLLQGKVAGVNVTSVSGEPGASQDIIIRGVGSLRTGTTPLYVVDGFALDNTGNGLASNPLNFINPQDIESINILKDASAAAIYGARAANGVVVITTKKGKTGKTQVNFSVATAFSTLARKVNVFNANEFRKNINIIGGTLVDGSAATDWQDELTRTAISNNVNFSMSGGTEQSTYFASLSGENQEGIFNFSNLKRYSGRLNLTQRAIENRFKVEFNLTGTRLENNRPNIGSLVNSMLRLNPTVAIKTNNELIPLLSNGMDNPLLNEKRYSDITFNNRILANISPSFEITEGLNYKLSLGADYSSTSRDIQNMPFATETSENIGSLNTTTTENYNTLLENTLTYSKISEYHNFNALVGHAYQKTKVTQKHFSLSGFPVNGVEPKYQIETASEPTTQSAYATVNELQSYFGRVNYVYADKYMLTATLRADGSSKFGKNNKYGYFPSFALGWNISNENFFSNSPFNNLKIRASWGQTGNQEIPAKQTKASYTESNTGNDTYPLEPSAKTLSNYPYGTIFTRLANPDLQWEVSTQANIGLDFELLQGQLTGTFDYFNKVASNILLEVTPVDPIQPTDKYWTNVPNMQIRNSGIEIALDYHSDNTKDFSYQFGGNIAITKNTVKDSPYQILTTGAAQGAGQTGATINGILNNKSIGSFYVKDFIGIGENGLNMFRDINNDGNILDNDRIVPGSALPNYIYAFYLNLKYKNFDLGLNFNGAGGHKIYNHVAMSLFNIGSLSQSFNTTDAAIKYKNESFSNSNIVSTRYIENASYLRLNNTTLGYNLRPEVLGLNNFINNIRLSITGQNLFVITDYSGYDPEINTGSAIGGVQTFGIDYYSYPKNRTVLFGLNLAF